MADFCKQCSIDMFGRDYGDLARIANKNGRAMVLCEGCGGNRIVSRNGTCVSETCLKQHGKMDHEGDESMLVEQRMARYFSEYYDEPQGPPTDA